MKKDTFDNRMKEFEDFDPKILKRKQMTKDEFLIWLTTMPENAKFEIGPIISIDTNPATINGTIEFSYEY